MNIHFKRLALISLLAFFTFASISEARIGGGRSSGFRGSRGFGSRSYQPATPVSPARSSQQPYSAQPQPMGQPAPAGGMGSFGRGLLGGLAGGFIGSMLFGGMSHGMGGASSGGFGLLEILLLAGLGFVIYRKFAGRKLAMNGGGSFRRESTPMEAFRSVEPGPFAQSPQAQNESEDSRAAILSAHDPIFDLAQFKDQRTDDFMKLQAAWNYRDLSSVSSLLSPALLQQLESDVADLKRKGQINRIENIAVRACTLIEAWQESGKEEYATLRFRANLTDYTVDESSGSVIAGDQVQPIKFEEDWTFVRRTGLLGSPWMVSAIEA